MSARPPDDEFDRAGAQLTQSAEGFAPVLK